MNENEALYALWIKTVTEKHPAAAQKAAKCFRTAEEVYKSGRSDFPGDFSEKYAELFMNKDLSAAKKIYERCEKAGIRIIPFSSPEMPAEVKNLEKPPCLLFARGTGVFSEKDIRVAIVGSRKPTALGKKTASRLAYELSSAGITVISGMAAGTDTAAHKGALYFGKETFAFLGGGADVVYPAENAELYGRIIRNGAAVSEYLPGTGAQGFHFPERNRLLSAFSKAVIVIESAENGGTMRTAEHAIKQGVPVLAVPGPVDSPQSAGTNRLIKEGHRAVTCSDDVISFLNAEYGLCLSVKKRLSSVAVSAAEPPEKPGPEKKERKPSEKPRNSGKTEEKPENATDCFSLSDIEKKVYETVKMAGSCAVDDVCNACGISFGEAFSAISELELEGLLTEAEAGRYRTAR